MLRIALIDILLFALPFILYAAYMVAVRGIAPDGSRRPSAVLLNLLTRPADLAPLIRLARDSDAALRQLRRVASLVGSALFTPPG